MESPQFAAEGFPASVSNVAPSHRNAQGSAQHFAKIMIVDDDLINIKEVLLDVAR